MWRSSLMPRVTPFILSIPFMLSETTQSTRRTRPPIAVRTRPGQDAVADDCRQRRLAPGDAVADVGRWDAERQPGPPGAAGGQG
jgi:hypothetical protein